MLEQAASHAYTLHFSEILIIRGESIKNYGFRAGREILKILGSKSKSRTKAICTIFCAACSQRVKIGRGGSNLDVEPDNFGGNCTHFVTKAKIVGTIDMSGKGIFFL